MSYFIPIRNAYRKVISGGVFNLRYSKKKRKSTPALTTGHRSLLLAMKV